MIEKCCYRKCWSAPQTLARMEGHAQTSGMPTNVPVCWASRGTTANATLTTATMSPVQKIHSVRMASTSMCVAAAQDSQVKCCPPFVRNTVHGVYSVFLRTTHTLNPVFLRTTHTLNPVFLKTTHGLNPVFLRTTHS